MTASLILRWAWLAALVAVWSWFFWPRSADLRGFAPERVGGAEATMWRHYYEPRHALLVWDVYAAARDAYGFSPFESVRLSWHAARAASLFHGNGDATRHQAALEHMKSYYGIVAALNPSLDAGEAARMELQWWREHRARQYEACAGTVAALSAAIYGGDAARYLPAARQRVEAMKRCDAQRSRALTEADWKAIREGLIASYRLLREAALDTRLRQ